ncbi:MAG: hydroxymethylbilane synthase [Gemmatimonadetes bacterium]|jgi:hydroxymethylbilane synthase|nr:hydroxymethylbilane synthase [Gemmatimonadota bacterium]MDE0963215.1 hydroxymethylbilane synthase [Candidatus Latescibacterota bacterium]MBT5328367.1 hydroxymethylbilane synthase [Gemmatimonadota bacterium]MBT5448050.1 hydroxymethylbilane synthase [Gemmatimonadota bacterium]MBT5800664.1 hydroxymethylbilane synthase [Gemmatimonadota bacterium]
MTLVKLVIGSRGSKLALTQTYWVRDRLQAHNDSLEIEVLKIRTTGDQATGSLRSFGGAGVFTKELERALLEGQIDLAIHSLKDLPTQMHPELALVATPEREDVRDALIGPDLSSLADLPNGARLGTGSLRRRAQLKALRPDLEILDIRGNLDTRIDKAMRGECDAVVLAVAGLNRLGWQQRIGVHLSLDQVLPAPGQGALGLQMRADNPLKSYVGALNHAPTQAAVQAERQLLQTLRAGCHAPVGAWARLEEDQLTLDGLVGHPDGTEMLRARHSAPLTDAQPLGEAVAAALREQGADALLQAE